MRKSPLLLLPLLIALLACNLPTLVPGRATDTPAPPPAGPSPTALPAPASPVPVEPLPDVAEGFPALERQAAAMRAGFEQDLAAFAQGPRYLVSMALEPYAGGISVYGTERVLYHNNTGAALSDIVFRLVPNGIGPDDSLVIDALRGEGLGEARFETGNTVLRLPLNQPLAPGDSLILELDFTLDLPDGVELGYGRSAYINGTLVFSSCLPLLSVHDADGWWRAPLFGPGDPAYSETALFDLTIRAPQDWQMAVTGTVIDQQTAEGITTYEVVTGPVRDISLAAGPNLVGSAVEQDGVTIRAWSPGGDPVGDPHALRLGAQSVEVFDREFGLYPYAELDIVAAEVSAAGIEYPGLIYIAAGLWNPEDAFFDIVIIHEVGHQWWYGLVGNNQVIEPWLDEGLTEYAVQVFYRETKGPETAAIIREGYQSELDWYLDGQGEGVPLGLPADDYDGPQYRVFVYSAGALFFAELEDQYGTGAMRAFLQSYFESQRYGLVSNAELRDLLVTHFDEQAGEFFDQWVVEGEF